MYRQRGVGRLGVERTAAAAALHRVWIVESEASAADVFEEIDGRAIQVEVALFVDNYGDPMQLAFGVDFLIEFFVETECVLEATQPPPATPTRNIKFGPIFWSAMIFLTSAAAFSDKLTDMVVRLHDREKIGSGFLTLNYTTVLRKGSRIGPNRSEFVPVRRRIIAICPRNDAKQRVVSTPKQRTFDVHLRCASASPNGATYASPGQRPGAPVSEYVVSPEGAIQSTSFGRPVRASGKLRESFPGRCPRLS